MMGTHTHTHTHTHIYLYKRRIYSCLLVDELLQRASIGPRAPYPISLDLVHAEREGEKERRGGLTRARAGLIYGNPKNF